MSADWWTTTEADAGWHVRMHYDPPDDDRPTLRELLAEEEEDE